MPGVIAKVGHTHTRSSGLGRSQNVTVLHANGGSRGGGSPHRGGGGEGVCEGAGGGGGEDGGDGDLEAQFLPQTVGQGHRRQTEGPPMGAPPPPLLWGVQEVGVRADGAGGGPVDLKDPTVQVK